MRILLLNNSERLISKLGRLIVKNHRHVSCLTTLTSNVITASGIITKLIMQIYNKVHAEILTCTRGVKQGFPVAPFKYGLIISLSKYQYLFI